ncbi:MAG TPA: zinc ribbon domain-containing protein [Candidatus Olsenella excrementavium]|uniref:Zinc ribbon domain-containing protein n=1 Tax=Candidatus Olsenella excrementavium TaxID=2838709 RepID=A0A9D1ZBB4_9ACTN|nr:zinc ribbon domain-containing protein [Candidatus Olsenella excrementavium]
MFCPRCGSNQLDHATYCSKCGARLSGGSDSHVTSSPLPKNAPPSSSSPFEKVLLGISTLVCGYLAINLLGVILGRMERVIEGMALYGISAVVMGSIILYVLALGTLLLLIIIAGCSLALLISDQQQLRWWESLRRSVSAATVIFVSVLVLSRFFFDSPSLSNDFHGTMYLVFGLLGGWTEEQLLFLLAAGFSAVGTIVSHAGNDSRSVTLS